MDIEIDSSHAALDRAEKRQFKFSSTNFSRWSIVSLICYCYSFTVAGIVFINEYTKILCSASIEFLKGFDIIFSIYFLYSFVHLSVLSYVGISVDSRDYQRGFKGTVKYWFYKFGWVNIVTGLPIMRLPWLRFLLVIPIVQYAYWFWKSPVSLKNDYNTLLIFIGTLMALFVAVALPAALLEFESRGSDHNIKTPGDAAFFTLTTSSTTGYGDLYPTTIGGRYVSGLMQIFGVATVATMTSAITTTLSRPIQEAQQKRKTKKYKLESEITIVLRELTLLRQQMDTIEKRLCKQQVQLDSLTGYLPE